MLDYSVFEVDQRNAGAFGPLTAADITRKQGQLTDLGSLRGLEFRLAKSGLDPRQLWKRPQNWSDFDEYVQPWLEQTADALAYASISSCSVIDFEVVIIDGAMPCSLREKLVDMIRLRLGNQDTRGLVVPNIVEGTVGDRARKIGAAVGPIVSQFLLDRTSSLFDQH
ncbi:MAG: ROK family protein [Tateyamaria sp.]|nr:ROK family protein [Tateyamaria sp.]